MNAGSGGYFLPRHRRSGRAAGFPWKKCSTNGVCVFSLLVYRWVFDRNLSITGKKHQTYMWIRILSRGDDINSFDILRLSQWTGNPVVSKSSSTISGIIPVGFWTLFTWICPYLRSKSPNLWQFLVGSLSFCFQQLDFGVFLQFLDITPGYHHLMELLNIKFEQGGTPIDS